MIEDNRQAFQAYVEQLLVRELKPGDIVIMDNLLATTSCHSPGHRGCRCPSALPAALQPGIQPDRDDGAKFKALLRAAAERTIRCCSLLASLIICAGN
jgi:hypothetical protein